MEHLFNFLKEIFKDALAVANQFQLLAYGIAALLGIVLLGNRKKLPKGLLALIAVCIFLLAAVPAVSNIIRPTTEEPYRITVTVVKANGAELPDPKIKADVFYDLVTNAHSSQLEISQAHLPSNHTVTITATNSAGTLMGSKQITLKEDRNPSLQITVDPTGGTMLHGNVYSRAGNPLSKITVGIEGGDPAERGITDQFGAFQFKTHFPEGQAITVVATNGRRTIRQQHVAGDDPVHIVF